MNVGSSSANIKVEIKTEADEVLHSSDNMISEELQTSIKTENEEIWLPSEPPESTDSITIKKEEICITSELPSKENDSSVRDASDEIKHLFRCYLCDAFTFLENKNALREHLLASHPTRSKYNCSECDYWTKDKSTYNNHLARHDASKKLFKCNSCSLGFNRKRSLQYHEIMKHNLGGSQPHYDCTICKKQLASLRGLSVHMKAHTYKRKDPVAIEKENDALPNHKCYICNTVFENDGTLTCHIKTIHSNEDLAEQFQCKDCEYTINQPIAFNRHLKVHDASINFLKCSFCTRKFSTERYKQYHEITKHGNTIKQNPVETKVNKLWKCYLCKTDNMLQSRNALVLHLKVHPKRHIIECDKCKFSTRRKLAYNDHRAKHDMVPDSEQSKIDVDSTDQQNRKKVQKDGPEAVLAKKIKLEQL